MPIRACRTVGLTGVTTCHKQLLFGERSAFALACSYRHSVAHLFVKSKQGTPAGVVLSSRRLKADGYPERSYYDLRCAGSTAQERLGQGAQT